MTTDKDEINLIHLSLIEMHKQETFRYLTSIIMDETESDPFYDHPNNCDQGKKISQEFIYLSAVLIFT